MRKADYPGSGGGLTLSHLERLGSIKPLYISCQDKCQIKQEFKCKEKISKIIEVLEEFNCNLGTEDTFPS